MAIPDSLVKVLEDSEPAALAFSGGTDSSYLLYACVRSGIDCVPYIFRTEFQKGRELERAQALCAQLGADLRIIETSVLDGTISANTSDRCYLCKRRLFETLIKYSDGRTVMDGTNASDDYSARPGMRALIELNVRSPLREAGITKNQVRQLSKEAGLSTWNLPSDSCLATRIPTFTPITSELLQRTEKAETEIEMLGFTDFRVRTVQGGALLELSPEDKILLESCSETVEKVLLKYYDGVSYGERRR